MDHKALKNKFRDGFSEQIGNIVSSRDVFQFDLCSQHKVSDKMVLDVDELRTLVSDWIVSQCDGGSGVHVDY